MHLVALLAVLTLTIAATQARQVHINVNSKPKSCPAKSKDGDTLSVIYTGKLHEDGTKFDSNVGRAPFDFVLGSNQVIKGWEQGLKDMCIGEKRTLTIPSDLGYGTRGAGSVIPPNADLLFDVELVKINHIDAKGYSDL